MQILYVVVPHLMPLVTFVALIQLMDNFRVLEPIIGFQAQAHAQSLSWIILNDLGGETRATVGGTTSVLTLPGVIHCRRCLCAPARLKEELSHGVQAQRMPTSFGRQQTSS